ncbi:MAG: hypothetical protein LBB14_03120 [Puniceicoccales bacterium]|nr:hypothetical protein [Puniceicoccales bacterium]
MILPYGGSAILRAEDQFMYSLRQRGATFLEDRTKTFANSTMEARII